MQKKTSRGEIWGVRSDNNSQEYSVFPTMSNVTDRGIRGTVSKNVLTTGDIKECFDIPNQLPAGNQLHVTVLKRAVLRQIGSEYELKERGQLSVS